MFLIAGVLLLIFTTILGAVAFTDFGVRAVRSVFGPGGFAFALAVLRTDLFPRSLGLLLLGAAAIFAVNFVRGVTLGRWTPIWAPFLLGAAQAVVVHLAIGVVLRDEAAPEEETVKGVEAQTA